jgi:arylsulfatase
MPNYKRNTLDDSFTLNIDLAETVLGAAGVKPHPRMQGRDISDLYLTPDGKDSWRDEFFYDFQFDKWGEMMPTCSALVRKRFKYLYWPQFKYEQLFDLATDPLEMDDIVNNTYYSRMLDFMRQRHNDLEKAVV